MSKYPLASILLLCLMAVSCTEKRRPLSKAAWLAGTWVSQTSKGSLYETWNKVDNTRMTAKSYYLNDGDTVLFETVELVEAAGKVQYIVSAPKENGETPVAFTATTLAPDRFVFENKAHDFPQMITYRKISGDSLVAEVSGMIEGKMEKEIFSMRRMQ
jgi:hypothetical protein